MATCCDPTAATAHSSSLLVSYGNTSRLRSRLAWCRTKPTMYICTLLSFLHTKTDTCVREKPTRMYEREGRREIKRSRRNTFLLRQRKVSSTAGIRRCHELKRCQPAAPSGIVNYLSWSIRLPKFREYFSMDSSIVAKFWLN